MAIISADFHGNLTKLEKFLKYRPEEKHIFAGDAIDSYTITPEQQELCLKTLMTSNCILLYGNHELSYSHNIACSGRHYYGIEHFPKYFRNERRWRVAYVEDGYLITHAGVSKYHAGNFKTPTSLAKYLNASFRKKCNPSLFQVGVGRGGWSICGGPFWYDFRYDDTPLAPFNQVFGHCSLKTPWEKVEEGNHWVCINSPDSTDEVWVFDTKEKKVIIL